MNRGTASHGGEQQLVRGISSSSSRRRRRRPGQQPSKAEDEIDQSLYKKP
jgi:hypothetical protein